MSPPAAPRHGPLHPDTCEPLRRAAAAGDVRLAALSRGTYPGARLRGNTLPGVRSLGFWDARRPQAWGLDWHHNEGLELTYVARGRLAFSVEGRPVPLRRGDLTVTRPWQIHRVGNPHVAASELHWLILDVGVRRPNQRWRWPSWVLCEGQELAELTTILRRNEQPVWRAGGDVARAFLRLSGEVAAASPSMTRLRLGVNELIVALRDLLRREAPRLDDTLTTSHRSVELFLAGLPGQLQQPWTVDAMAQRCGLARSRFCQLVRQVTNQSPVEHLTRCRVEAAARLLRQQRELPVTAVAAACGFQSSQYFATVFRRHTGAAPLAWRAQA